MLNVEHLLDNAVCNLEKYEVHEAYRQFMESPCNIELAENAGIRLDDVWVMAVYCNTTLRQYWKEEWEKEAERWIPVTERPPESKVDVLCCIHYKNGRTGVNQGWYSALNEKWYIGVSGIHVPVTHWMPMPDGPKEDADA